MVGVGRKSPFTNLWSHGDDGAPGGGGPVFGSGYRVRGSFFGFPFCGDVREVSQILILTDRTDHLHDVRPLRAGSILSSAGAAGLLSLLCASPLSE